MFLNRRKNENVDYTLLFMQRFSSKFVTLQNLSQNSNELVPRLGFGGGWHFTKLQYVKNNIMIDQAIIPELEIRTDISATLLQLGGYNDVQEIQPSGEVGGSYNGNKDKGWAYK